VTGGFRIEVLEAGHDRTAFRSGVDALDRYLREQASQDMRRRASTCYVALDNDDDRIAAYYTLAAGGIPLTDLPEAQARRLPRYPSVPVARMGRLAVDLSFRGQQVGAALLGDAVKRAMRSELAVFALVVDAKDEAAEAFYRHHGFMIFGSTARQLFVPLASFAKRTSSQ
jgi:ribosomal protein S18 acetylase RimI-like enzyme